MKISVVLASYNGEKYIYEQLASIMRQTKKVDEVIISDDHSTDETLTVCKNFIEENHLKDWIIINNQSKKGFYANFCNGLRAAQGDLIVLCDQDDIWNENKIQVMSEYFKANKNILSLASTFSRFRGNQVFTMHQKHKHAKKGTIKKITVDEFLRFPEYLGMSMMVSKALVTQFLSICDTLPMNHSHDVEMNFIAVVEDGFYYLDKALTQRRSYHESTSHQHTDELDLYTNPQACQYMKRSSDGPNFEMIAEQTKKPQYCSKIKGFSIQYRKRAEYIQNRDVLQWLTNIVNLKYYDGLSDYIKDLFRMKH